MLNIESTVMKAYYSGIQAFFVHLFIIILKQIRGKHGRLDCTSPLTASY